jgi:thymidylate synthase (FAD)
MEPDGILRFLKEHCKDWPEFETRLDPSYGIADQDAEWIVEMSARLCYLSFGGKGRSHRDHIVHLLEVAHGSTLEHAVFGFLIWNVSRSLTHELVRTRQGVAYSQLSQRYVDESDTDFVVPPAIEALAAVRPDLRQKWDVHMGLCADLYKELVGAIGSMYSELQDPTERRKKARQAARSVLPNATETKIAVSVNARALRWFIQMRANPAADVEIRRLAVEMYRIAAKVAPLLFYDMKLVPLQDGTEGIESKHHKV